MNKSFNVIICLSIVLLLSSCSDLRIRTDEQYQPLGPAVLAANGLLLIAHSHDCPENMTSDEYKVLLKDDYRPMYNRLLSYLIQLKMRNDHCTISVFDEQKLILTDWLCTEGRIDCWSYNRECDPDAFRVKCDN